MSKAICVFLIVFSAFAELLHVSEQIQEKCVAFYGKQLGMELYADDGQAVALHGLDTAVRRTCADSQSGCQSPNGLMVEAVHLGPFLSQYSIKSRVMLYVDDVRCAHVSNCCVGVFAGQVLIERAAEKHIKHLNAATDAQNGFSQTNGLSQYAVFKGIALHIHLSQLR